MMKNPKYYIHPNVLADLQRISNVDLDQFIETHVVFEEVKDYDGNIVGRVGVVTFADLLLAMAGYSEDESE